MGVINRPNFLQLDGFTFSFNMTNHLNLLITKTESLTAICRKISSYHQSVLPNWTRLRADFRIFKITSENELLRYMDANSQGKCLNWLIFSRKGDQIFVTHLGPFTKNKDKDIENKVDQTRQSQRKLNEIWRQVCSSSQPEKQKEVKQNYIENDIKEKFLAMMQAVEEQIEAKKRELIEAVKNAFDSEENREHITNKITQVTVKSRADQTESRALMKEITEEIKNVKAKHMAKLVAETVSQGAVSIVTKGVPFAGLAVGSGLAIWRLVDGDVAGAGLEFAAGAASCIPGVGTAASVAIGTALVAKDVKNAVGQAKEREEKFKSLEAVTERTETELNVLFTDYEKAKEEYDFVCEVLGEPEYAFEKLEHDIKVVDEVLRELHDD